MTGKRVLIVRSDHDGFTEKAFAAAEELIVPGDPTKTRYNPQNWQWILKLKQKDTANKNNVQSDLENAQEPIDFMIHFAR